MSSPKEHEPPTPSAGDNMHSLTRAGLSAVPYIGGAAAELFNRIIAPPLEKRRQGWMEGTAERLGSLEEKMGVVLEELRGRDSFIDTFMQASQIAMRNSQQEKLDALRNAVLNSALPEPPDESLQQMFLGYVDTLTVWHMRILRLFHNPTKWLTENDRKPPAKVVSTGRDEVIEAAYDELKERPDFCSQILSELEAKGLAEKDSPGNSYSQPVGKFTTGLGDQFIKFITDPRPESTTEEN